MQNINLGNLKVEILFLGSCSRICKDKGVLVSALLQYITLIYFYK